MEEIRDILPRFGFQGRFASARELTSGHINATYLLDFRDGGKLNQYTLQRINTYVFHHPDEVMSNITRVTEHLRRGILRLRGDAARRGRWPACLGGRRTTRQSSPPGSRQESDRPGKTEPRRPP